MATKHQHFEAVYQIEFELLFLHCATEEILLIVFSSSCAWQGCFILDIHVAYRQVKGCGYRARSSWDLLPAEIQCRFFHALESASKVTHAMPCLRALHCLIHVRCLFIFELHV